MKRRCLVTAVVFVFAFAFGVGFVGTGSRSLLLWNDSSYTLTARVQAANGAVILEQKFNPQERQQVAFSLSSGQMGSPPSESMTPLTVTWVCPAKDYFSSCSDVSPGSLVRAGSCPGGFYCMPPKKKEGQPSSQNNQSTSTGTSQES